LRPSKIMKAPAMDITIDVTQPVREWVRHAQRSMSVSPSSRKTAPMMSRMALPRESMLQVRGTSGVYSVSGKSEAGGSPATRVWLNSELEPAASDSGWITVPGRYSRLAGTICFGVLGLLQESFIEETLKF